MPRNLTGDLALTHRYSDWHLSRFRQESLWSVSVFTAPGSRDVTDVPDGRFILEAGWQGQGALDA